MPDFSHIIKDVVALAIFLAFLVASWVRTSNHKPVKTLPFPNAMGNARAATATQKKRSA